MEKPENPGKPSKVEETQQAAVPVAQSTDTQSTGVQVVNPLSSEEKQQFAKLEKVVEAKLADFFDVGLALSEIKTKELFRETHSNFHDYCEARWTMGRSYANKLIGSVERILLLPPNVPRPANEFQIRPFLDLEPEDFPKKWEEIVNTVGIEKVTRDVVIDSLNLPKKKKRKRKVKASNQQDEVKELLADIRASLDEEDVAGAKKYLAKLEKLFKA